GDVHPAAVRRDRHADGLGQLAEQGDGFDDPVLVGVDHGYRTTDLVGDVGTGERRRERRAARPDIDEEALDDRAGPRIDHRNRVARLGRDVDPPTIGTDRHPFRLDPDFQGGEYLAAGEVGDRGGAGV